MGNWSLRWFEVKYIILFHTQDVWIWPTSQFQPVAWESARNVLVPVDFKLSEFMVGTARSRALGLLLGSERALFPLCRAAELPGYSVRAESLVPGEKGAEAGGVTIASVLGCAGSDPWAR